MLGRTTAPTNGAGDLFEFIPACINKCWYQHDESYFCQGSTKVCHGRREAIPIRYGKTDTGSPAQASQVLRPSLENALNAIMAQRAVAHNGKT